MFSKILFVATFIAAVFAGDLPASQCAVGHLQCCDSVQPAGSDAASQLLALVGANVQGVAVPIGITCSPISVIAVGAASNCAAQPVCCEDNNYNGVVAVGCTPVNVGA